uniref:Uncharacterized protein n=1 Tax=Pseudo-nitzschia australis TaxID=44445 RepID=A0A7S4AHS3_9STRA
MEETNNEIEGGAIVDDKEKEKENASDDIDNDIDNANDDNEKDIDNDDDNDDDNDIDNDDDDDDDDNDSNKNNKDGRRRVRFAPGMHVVRTVHPFHRYARTWAAQAKQNNTPRNEPQRVEWVSQ